MLWPAVAGSLISTTDRLANWATVLLLALGAGGARRPPSPSPGLLPEPQRSEASRLLRDYIDLRIRVPTLAGRAEVEEAVKRAEGIQDALWAQAAALADRPTMALAGFLQSLTELSDLQVKRVRAAVSPSRRSC